MESENMMNQDAQEELKAQEMENTPKAIPQENTMTQGMPGETIKKSDVEKTKMSKKQVIGLVVLSLIALGGVLFGIYGMNSQNDQIANLKVQMSDANNKVSQLETGKVTITDSDETVTKITDSVNTVVVDTTDYIYVGEWGLKIKIPEGLSAIGYKFDESNYGEHLSVAGVKGEGVQNAFHYTNTDKFFAGAIMRSNSEDGFYPYGTLVYTDDEQNKYYFEGPQADMGSTEEETNIWKESVKIIKEMLTNPDNYSKI